MQGLPPRHHHSTHEFHIVFRMQQSLHSNQHLLGNTTTTTAKATPAGNQVHGCGLSCGCSKSYHDVVHVPNCLPAAVCPRSAEEQREGVKEITGKTSNNKIYINQNIGFGSYSEMDTNPTQETGLKNLCISRIYAANTAKDYWYLVPGMPVLV